MQARVSRWLDDQIARGKLPRAEILVQHKGKLVCKYNNSGAATVKPKPGEEVIYRMYSMTKPIVSLAVMLLFEEGRFQLNEPIWKFLGEKWKKQNMKVMDLTKKQDPITTVPCNKSITVYHLLTHTSGLSHGLAIPGVNDPLDVYYNKVGLGSSQTLLRRSEDVGVPTLQELCDRLAECPLLFQPGDYWNYSYSVDLLGRIIEVVSGQSLEDFLQERILKKLGMVDTSFICPKEKESRLSEVWLTRPGGPKNIGSSALLPKYFSGSAGLVGTCHDYLLFAEMLLRGGLSRDGERIVSRKTLEWMTTNHLRDKDQRLRTIRQSGLLHFADDKAHGIGFGLGFGVISDPPMDSFIATEGTYFWSGAASTLFWVDPKEQLIVVLGTALLLPDPLETPINPPLRALIYGALDHDVKKDDVLLPSSKL